MTLLKSHVDSVDTHIVSANVCIVFTLSAHSPILPIFNNYSMYTVANAETIKIIVIFVPKYAR